MLSRLFSRRGTRSSVAAFLAVRQLRTTAAVLGGHHHDEAPPPHIPRPASGERTWFGEVKPARISKDNEYKPGKDDIYSYIGAFVGVALTVLAVKKYALKEDDHKKEEGKKKQKESGHREKKETKPAVDEKTTTSAVEKTVEEHPKEEEKEENTEESLHPVVEKKLVIVPVEVEKVYIEDEVNAEGSKKVISSEESASTSSEPSTASEPLPVGQLPESVPYLLVGGGTASYYAALVIRARDPNARVLIISDESHLPYNRPPLSKELWWYGSDRSREHLEYRSPSGRTRDVFQEAEGFFVPVHQLTSTAHGGVSIVKSRKVTRVDAHENKAYLEDGTTIRFEKCLLATGGSPRCLPQLEESSDDVKTKVIYYRGVDDYRRLDEEVAKAKSITVIGGGFLGSELAYSIKRKHEKVEVNQMIPDHGQLSSVLPQYLSKHANEEMNKMGIKVHCNSHLSSAVSSPSGRLSLSIDKKGRDSKEQMDTDLIVVAIGIQPNVDIAKDSGFEVDPINGGIVADAELRVRGNVFAAGDVCSYFDEKLGRRRCEHWENAQNGGRLAGENMSGGKTAFWFQPSFFTKIAPNLLLSAVGDTSSDHETVSVFRQNTETGEKYDRGVVFYVKNEKIVGVLMVNLIGSGIDVARRLIDDGKQVGDFKEIAKLFPLYDNEKPVEDEKTE